MLIAKKQLTVVLIVVLALISQMTLVLAGEIPGYIGQQTFRLQDDPQLMDLTRRTEDLKVEVARIDQSKSQYEDQIEVMERQRNEQVERMNALQRDIDGARATKVSLEAKLVELKKNPEVNAEAITALQVQITASEQSILEKSKQYGALKMELGPINVRLDQIKGDYAIVLKRSQDAMIRLQNAARDRESYRQDLLSSISFVNKEGANRGQVDVS